MKISTKKTEVFYLSKRPKAVYVASERQYTAADGEVQVLYLPVVFMSDGRRNKIDTRIGKINALLRELYRSMVTKRELLNTAKL